MSYNVLHRRCCTTGVWAEPNLPWHLGGIMETPYHSHLMGQQTARNAYGVRAWEVRRSECRAVVARIRIETLSVTKVGLRRIGLSWQDNLENRLMRKSK